MAAQKQDDQLERTFSSYMRIQDVVLKTYLGRWTIGRSGEERVRDIRATSAIWWWWWWWWYIYIQHIVIISIYCFKSRILNVLFFLTIDAPILIEKVFFFMAHYGHLILIKAHFPCLTNGETSLYGQLILLVLKTKPVKLNNRFVLIKWISGYARKNFEKFRQKLIDK